MIRMDALIAMGVLVSIMLMAILATLFDRLSRHVDEVDEDLRRLQQRLGERMDAIDAQLGSLKLELRARTDAVSTRLDGIVAESATTVGRVMRLEEQAHRR